MLEAIRRAISLLRQRQLLHRLGVLVSVTVIGIACYVLYHMLRHINVDEVIEAIKGTETHQIVLAALFVAAGYFTLTFYDWFAVRAIGRGDIPYYPIRLADEQGMLRRYIELARATPGVSFIGRLGTYRYLDMDVTISEASSAANALLSAIARGYRPPAFFVEP